MRTFGDIRFWDVIEIVYFRADCLSCLLKFTNLKWHKEEGPFIMYGNISSQLKMVEKYIEQSASNVVL